jgi:hypothetical protein
MHSPLSNRATRARGVQRVQQPASREDRQQHPRRRAVRSLFDLPGRVAELLVPRRGAPSARRGQRGAWLLLLVVTGLLGACAPQSLTASPPVNPGGGFTLEGRSPRAAYTVRFVVGTPTKVRTETAFVLGRVTALSGIQLPVGTDVPATRYADPGEIVVGSGLSCHTAGEGGCTTVFGTSTEITASVLTVAPNTPAAALRPTLLHELGHAVGLAHWSGAPAQVMNPALQSFTDYQAGDMNGLAVLRGMAKAA